MISVPEVAFLSSSRILEDYFKTNNFYESEEYIKKISSLLFLDFHTFNHKLPDYAYKNLIEKFIKFEYSDNSSRSSLNDNNGNNDNNSNNRRESRKFGNDYSSLLQLLIKSFKNITGDYIYFIDKKAYIESTNFKNWQDVITLIPPLPIISFAIYNKSKESYRFDILSFVKEIFKQSAIPSVYEPELEDFIKNEGLREIHLHLNGTAETDYVWQNALKSPKKFFINIKSSLRLSKDFYKSLEQYLQISNLAIDDIYRLLVLAGKLRQKILLDIKTQIFSNNSPDLCKRKKCKTSNRNFNDIALNFMNFEPYIYADKIHPFRALLMSTSLDSKTTELYMSEFFSSIMNYSSKNRSMADESENMGLNYLNSLQYEAMFLIYAFYCLENKINIAPKLHYYLLIYSFFNKLLVQQISQVGFDQFQRITENDIRRESEKQYKSRLFQLNGMYGEDLIHLEGRFAPKTNSYDTYNLLKKIIDPYKKESEKTKKNSPGGLHYDLSLVCHFIKIKDYRYKTEERIKNIYTLRDLELRSKLLKNINSFFSVSRLFKGYTKYVSGFDAASNELYVGAEVFAPTYRYLRFLGFNNFTYHAGEDFIHLLSGIRAVYEAVYFLDLYRGDRIGHATALGIDAGLWLKRIRAAGNKIVIEQGEWLDNLVFLYHMATEYNIDLNLNLLKDEIRKMFRNIYFSDKNTNINGNGRNSRYIQWLSNFEIYDIIDAWKYRKIDPILSFDIYYGNDKDINAIMSDNFSFEKFKSKEIRKIIDLKNSNHRAFALFHEYHSSEVILQSKKLMEIDLSKSRPLFLSGAELFSELQRKVIKYMNDKVVAVESMPTSNVRISLYDDYSEHHIFRWLEVNSSAPIVCLGSDDPGIFAINIRNEFSHIFLELLNKNKTRKEAMDIIKHIADNNRIFIFRK